MALEVRKDLLERVQILLRKEAGLEEYNPKDASIYPDKLPSAEEVIANFDPSPEGLRCKHCEGKLLRGSQSLLCVYCGREQQIESLPEPISFGSTIGFRWLLDSLGLDGSEIVEPVNEDSQANRGLNYAKAKVSLSDFLDFKMKWPVESERFGLNDSDETQILGRKSLHLVGVDFDDSFDQLKTENSPRFLAERAISTEKVPRKEAETFPIEGVLGYLSNDQTSGISIKVDSVDNGDDSMSGWEADFQSASSNALPRDLNSFPVSQSNVVDYPSHKDSVAGPAASAKELQDGKVTDDSVTNDFWSNSFSAASASVKKSLVNTLADNVGKGSGPFNSSSAADSSQEIQQQNHYMESVVSVNDVEEDFSDTWNNFSDMSNNHLHHTAVPENAESSVKDDSSDAWNDLPGSKGAQENQQQNSNAEGPNEDFSDAWNDFTSSGALLESQNMNASEKSPVGVVDYSLDTWNDFVSLTNPKHSLQKTFGEEIVETVMYSNGNSGGLWSNFRSSMKQGDQKDGIFQSSINEMSKQDYNTYDLWDNFVGSSVGKDGQEPRNNFKSSGGQIDNDAVDMWGEFGSLNFSESSEQSGKAIDDKSIVKDGDPFDPWKDFASSVKTLDSNEPTKDGMKIAGNDTPDSTSQQSSTLAQAPEDTSGVEDDDSFNSWSDFRSSTAAVGPNPSSETDVIVAAKNTAHEDFSFGAWSDFRSSMPSQVSDEHSTATKASENKMAMEDDQSFSSWGDFRSYPSVQNNQCQENEAKAAHVDELFHAWSSSITDSGSAINNDKVLVPNLDTPYDKDNSFDAWSDFTSSTNVQDPKLQNKNEITGGSREAVKQQNDYFDHWNLLMNSSTSLNTFATSAFSSAIDFHNPRLSSSKSAAIDRSSFANLAAGSSDAPISFRTSSVGNEDDEPAAFEETTNKKLTDAEELISQMPDLSFMLKDSLSVPKKEE